MTSLDQCKNQFRLFLRDCLPPISQAINSIPSIPKFSVVPSSKPDSYKFVEEKQPNWWQLPKELKQTLFSSSEGQALIALLERTPPFSHTIGKEIFLSDRGMSKTYDSGIVLASEILVSYLFAAGVGRWKPTIFDRVWRDCVSYYDPEDNIVEYFLYAPIAFRLGITKQLDLGDGLAIRRLRNDEVARLASLNPALAGVLVGHRFTLWTTTFFVKRCEFEKHIVNKESTQWGLLQNSLNQWVSRLNEEVAILRSLLNEALAVPTYAFIRDGYPRDPLGGPPTSLPWRVNFRPFDNPPSRRELTNYTKRRAKFLELQGERGWENVAASMRRYAIAWENPFRADILADIGAALENLVVQSDREVSYKFRLRTAHFLEKTATKRQDIIRDLNVAYSYRSNVFHGGFVFDNPGEYETATRMKPSKKKLGKGGNPFHDVNEVHRLIYAVSDYYRRILKTMIDHELMEIDWTTFGL